MVKVTGPLTSTAASGSVAGAITFATWKGRPYVRELIKPNNPNTGKHLSVRAMMKFLSQEWAGISPLYTYTFNDRAEADGISPFNAYIKQNLSRWRNFLGISKSTDTLATHPNALTGVATAAGGVRMITVTMPVNNPESGWAILIFRKTGGPVTAAFDNLVAVLPIDGTNPGVFVDTPLEPATYYYNFYLCSTNAKLEFDAQSINATATP